MSVRRRMRSAATPSSSCADLPANNVLLTGARGTGKSSLIRACLHAFAQDGLRLVEVDKRDLVDLAELVALLEGRPERFIVFCDDLSFDASEAGYKELKAALDGSVAGRADNVLVYATSNRRHLMPEFMRDNLAAEHQDDGEVHPGEAVEERVSLSERFGLWLTFYPFRQDDYLDIVQFWLTQLGVPRRGAGSRPRGSPAVCLAARLALRARRAAVRARLFGAAPARDAALAGDDRARRGRRGGRRADPPRRPLPAGEPPGRQALLRTTGSSRAASSSPGRPSRMRSAANCTRNSASKSAEVYPVGRARVRVPACPCPVALLPCLRMVR